MTGSFGDDLVVIFIVAVLVAIGLVAWDAIRNDDDDFDGYGW